MENLWHWLQSCGPAMQSLLWRMWQWIQPVFTATLVTIEIALVGLFVSWRQLRYMQQRDEVIDIRNSWSETHKVMLDFRFKREQLNVPNLPYPMSANNAIAAAESLHLLRGQLERMPDSPLVEEITAFLDLNSAAENWRSEGFVEPFDNLAKQAALLARP